MPKQEQSITVSSLDKETILAISYSAFKQLNWDVQYAGDEKLLALTPKSWKANSVQIIATAANGQLAVSSEMIHGESFDMGGKNKKNIAAFLNVFESCRNTVGQQTIQQNLDTIHQLRIKTQQVAEQEAKTAAEIDVAMNLSKGNMYFTYAIIAINVLVFILMVIDGAGLMEPNGLVHVKWGSNYTPLTLSGDWWRLITNVFIHFGIIHLLANMYFLYMVGVYLEPMLGKVKYITAYLCTGIIASVVSLWWHKDGINSAGASGAIFGMYGLFLALLTTNLIPKQMRQPLLQSIVIFVVYNLAYGMKGGVDNAAHVGGLISGFIIGYIYVFGIKKEKQNEKTALIVPLVLLLSIGGTYGYLQQNKKTTEQRAEAMAEIKEPVHKDTDKFKETLQEIASIENKAIAPLADTTLGDAELKNKIDSLSYPLWTDAETKLNATKDYDISAAMHTKADKLLEYIGLRKQELDVYLKFINIGNSEGLVPALNEVRNKINNLAEEMQKL